MNMKISYEYGNYVFVFFFKTFHFRAMPKYDGYKSCFRHPNQKTDATRLRRFFQGHEHELLHRLHLVANDDGESIGKEGAESRWVVAAKARKNRST